MTFFSHVKRISPIDFDKNNVRNTMIERTNYSCRKTFVSNRNTMFYLGNVVNLFVKFRMILSNDRLSSTTGSMTGHLVRLKMTTMISVSTGNAFDLVVILNTNLNRRRICVEFAMDRTELVDLFKENEEFDRRRRSSSYRWTQLLQISLKYPERSIDIISQWKFRMENIFWIATTICNCIMWLFIMRNRRFSTMVFNRNEKICWLPVDWIQASKFEWFRCTIDFEDRQLKFFGNITGRLVETIEIYSNGEWKNKESVRHDVVKAIDTSITNVYQWTKSSMRRFAENISAKNRNELFRVKAIAEASAGCMELGVRDVIWMDIVFENERFNVEMNRICPCLRSSVFESLWSIQNDVQTRLVRQQNGTIRCGLNAIVFRVDRVDNETFNAFEMIDQLRTINVLMNSNLRREVYVKINVRLLLGKSILGNR